MIRRGRIVRDRYALAEGTKRNENNELEHKVYKFVLGNKELVATLYERDTKSRMISFGSDVKRRSYKDVVEAVDLFRRREGSSQKVFQVWENGINAWQVVCTIRSDVVVVADFEVLDRPNGCIVEVHDTVTLTIDELEEVANLIRAQKDKRERERNEESERVRRKWGTN